MSRVKFPKPSNYKRLLEYKNAKTTKGESLGYLTGILYLAPADESGRANLCPFASDGCRTACLYDAGRGKMQPIKDARLAKTHYYLDNPAAFMDSLRWDIAYAQRKAAKLGLKLAIRINGTSDLPKIALQMAREFPEVQFYDYTKTPRPWLRTLTNYVTTFSRSESNESMCIESLQHGVNVAVVFDALPAIKGRRAAGELPETWNGYRVIDGDKHDLRFLDTKGVVVGLRAKGTTAQKYETNGFVVRTSQNFVPLTALAMTAHA